ncbi:MAG: hypothetical protein V9E88_07480 [Ferruginibacter sp.]
MASHLNLIRARLAKIRALPFVQQVGLVAEEKALLQNGESQSVIQLKGVDEKYATLNGIAAIHQQRKISNG